MRYAAFLRAINVGGHIVKMDALRLLCEQCGLSNVETVIASGNVLFESRAAVPVLETKIEAHLRASLGYEVATFVRTSDELEAVVNRAQKALGGWKSVYVGFLKAPMTKEQQAPVQAFADPDQRFVSAGREIYWIVTGGVSDSKFSYAALERILKSPATFRNVNTVRKVAARLSP